uniref:Uncharacterized protein n=1 Tax=Romanomermis culicivorax TaxID=13658 RepID=A0A915JV03_ROMCU
MYGRCFFLEGRDNRELGPEPEDQLTASSIFLLQPEKVEIELVSSFYDKIGNRARWWSAATIKNYETKRQCLVQWYRNWVGNTDKSEPSNDESILKVDSSNDIYAFRIFQENVKNVCFSHKMQQFRKRSELPFLCRVPEQLGNSLGTADRNYCILGLDVARDP